MYAAQNVRHRRAALAPSFLKYTTKEHEVVASAEARPLLVRLHPISLRHSCMRGGGGGSRAKAGTSSDSGADRVDLCGPARKDGGAARAWLLPRRDMVDMFCDPRRVLCWWTAAVLMAMPGVGWEWPTLALLVDVVLAAAGWFMLGRSQGT